MEEILTEHAKHPEKREAQIRLARPSESSVRRRGADAVDAVAGGPGEGEALCCNSIRRDGDGYGGGSARRDG